MKPIAEMTTAEAAGIGFVLMDIDDTLTQKGKLLAESYAALWQLKKSGLILIPITGRSAGWCDLIVREWPVDGVVGENGAFALWEERAISGRPALKTVYHPAAVKNDHPLLAHLKAHITTEVPGIRLAKDQFSRLFDVAFDFAEEEPVLPLALAEQVQKRAVKAGAQAKISSIHVNVWIGQYNKLAMTEQLLVERFNWRPETDERRILFVGDSPNDEPMFARFPLACAVANIRQYRDYLNHYPAFVASQEGGHGFAEIAETILKLR